MKRKTIHQNYDCGLERNRLIHHWFAQDRVFPSLDKFHSTSQTLDIAEDHKADFPGSPEYCFDCYSHLKT